MSPGPDDLDLTAEAEQTRHEVSEPIPHEERTRRALLWVYGVLFGILTALQTWLGLTLTPEEYQAVAAVFGGASTVLAAMLGAAAIYYFTRRD